MKVTPTERGQLVVWLEDELLVDNTDSRRLAEALLDSEWLKQRVADAARAAAEKAWDEGWDAAPVGFELGDTVEPNPYRTETPR